MDLEGRLSRVERQNRRLVGMWLATIAVAASAVLMGQARPPSVLQARELQIVNGQGMVVGRFAASEADGLPYLWMGDHAGNSRVWLDVVHDEHGGGALLGLGLTDASPGTSRLVLRAYQDDAPSWIRDRERTGGDAFNWRIP